MFLTGFFGKSIAAVRERAATRFITMESGPAKEMVYGS
jgi:hypothetical protein